MSNVTFVIDAPATHVVDAGGSQGPAGPVGPAGAAGSEFVNVNAAVDLEANRVVAYNSSSEVVYASSDDTTVERILGINTTSVTTGNPATIRISGIQDWPASDLTPNAVVYLTTDGQVSHTPPAGAIRRVGVALAADKLQLDLGQVIPDPIDSIAGLTTVADQTIYTTGADTYATTSMTAFGRSLIDDTDAATARTTLGLGTAATTASTDYATAAQGATADSALQPAAIGTTVQAQDAGLESISGLTTAADQTIYTTASDTYATTSLTAFGRSLIDDADAATARTTLGLGTAATTASTDYATAAQGATADSALQPADIGTTVQAQDAGLQSISGLTTSADQTVYTTASDTYATTSLTAFGRSLIDDADAATARTTLGLGTAATTASTDYATAAQGATADTALQPAAIGSTVQAYDAGLTSIAGLTTAADKMVYTTALDTYAVTDLTAFARTVLDDADAATARTTLGAQAQSTSLDNLTTITTDAIPVKSAGGYVDSPLVLDANDTVTATKAGANPTVSFTHSGSGNTLELANAGSGVPLAVTGNITVTGTVDGRDIAADGTKLDGIEAGADVTDETNVVAALSGATLTDAGTPASNDKVLIQDTDDSNNLKYVDASTIGGGVGGSTGATDNALIRADGVGGSTVQGSTGATLDDSGNLTVATIDTGQGAVECYAMDQAVTTTSNVTYNNIVCNGINTRYGNGNAVFGEIRRAGGFLQVKEYLTEAVAATTGRGTSTGLYVYCIDSANSHIMLSTYDSGGTGGDVIIDADTLKVYRNDTSTLYGALIEQDSTGDASMSFLLTGGEQFTIGIDNSDSDKFKISDSSALGTNDRLTIDSSGLATFSAAVTADRLTLTNSNANNEILLTGTDYSNIYSETTSGFDIGTNSSSGTSYLRLLTENAERMRILANGNVHIGGTSDPGVKLGVTGAITATTWAKVGSYTVATVPSAATAGAGAIIYVSDETGGATIAFSDATNWRRVSDRAIVS